VPWLSVGACGGVWGQGGVVRGAEMPLDGPFNNLLPIDLPTPYSPSASLLFIGITHKPTAFKPHALSVDCTAPPRLLFVHNQPDASI